MLSELIDQVEVCFSSPFQNERSFINFDRKMNWIVDGFNQLLWVI